MFRYSILSSSYKECFQSEVTPFWLNVLAKTEKKESYQPAAERIAEIARLLPLWQTALAACQDRGKDRTEKKNSIRKELNMAGDYLRLKLESISPFDQSFFTEAGFETTEPSVSHSGPLDVVTNAVATLSPIPATANLKWTKPDNSSGFFYKVFVRLTGTTDDFTFHDDTKRSKILLKNLPSRQEVEFAVVACNGELESARTFSNKVPII